MVGENLEGDDPRSSSSKSNTEKRASHRFINVCHSSTGYAVEHEVLGATHCGSDLLLSAAARRRGCCWSAMPLVVTRRPPRSHSVSPLTFEWRVSRSLLSLGCPDGYFTQKSLVSFLSLGAPSSSANVVNPAAAAMMTANEDCAAVQSGSSLRLINAELIFKRKRQGL